MNFVGLDILLMLINIGVDITYAVDVTNIDTSYITNIEYKSVLISILRFEIMISTFAQNSQ